MRVYGDLNSGNCLKVKLLLSFLDLAHEWRHVDILAGETRTDEFLALNPNGKIPLVVLDDGRVLAESNAILGYLAEGTEFLSSDRYGRAKIHEWLFFEQYSHEPYIAVARFINKYLGLPEDRLEEYRSLQAGGHRALAIMEKQLTRTDFLVGSALSIADVALYAYTHVAAEGGFSLDAYPGIGRWVGAISARKGYVGMPDG